MTRRPCPDLATADQLPSFDVGVVAQALLCGIILMSAGRSRLLAFAGLVSATAFLGNWAIVNCPRPRNDVYLFQTDASVALGMGHDPYDMTFPNFFAPDDRLYGPGLVKNGRVQFGYPYMPESLLATMPASLARLDVRYSHVFAILLSAVLMVVISPGPLGFSAAMLFLTTPRLLFIVERCWTEPLVLLTLCATVACARKWPRCLPLALGLFLASKQYAPAAAVLFFVGARPSGQTIASLLKAAVVALAITLPLALWNLPAFLHSVVELQFRQPFRRDALSYLSWIGEAFWSKNETFLIPFTALLLSMLLILWRRRSTGFACRSCAVLYRVFFLEQAGVWQLLLLCHWRNGMCGGRTFIRLRARPAVNACKCERRTLMDQMREAGRKIRMNSSGRNKSRPNTSSVATDG